MKKMMLLLVVVSIFAQETSHGVKPGDTLWDIAGFYYQNPFLWPYIWRANLTKIEDPHWIYPEQVFVIPPAPEATVSEKPTPVAESVTQTAEEVPVYVPEVATLPQPEKPTTEIISVVQGESKMFNEEFVHRAGFILDEDIPFWGKIIGTEPSGESNITTFKKIYVDRAQGVKKGDILTIYRPGKVLRDPVSGDGLGKEIIVLGKAEVEAVAEGGSRCQVIASYDLIKGGDLVVPYEPIVIPAKVELIPTDRALEANIVEVKTIGGVSTSPNVLTYINRGENNDVAVGDMFDVYQKRGTLPDFKIAEVQIINVFKKASIGLLLWYRETATVNIGEHCRLAMESR